MKIFKEKDGWKDGNEVIAKIGRVNGTGKRYGITVNNLAIHKKIKVGTPPNEKTVTAEDLGIKRGIFFFHVGYDEGGNSKFEAHLIATEDAITDEEKKRNEEHSGWLY